MDNNPNIGRLGYIPKIGKPPSYTPEEFELKVNEYFEWVHDENIDRSKRRFEGEKFKPYTLSGICVYLGISRETWNEYSKKSSYADTTKRAKSIVENYTEEGLINGKLNPIGAIFNLKNNFGWVDKVDFSMNVTSEQLSASEIRGQLEQRRSLPALDEPDTQDEPK